MAGELNVRLANEVESPNRVFSVRTQNREFNTEPFDSDEASLLEEQFNTLINDFDTRLLSELFMQRRMVLAQAAAHSKQQFDEKRFGGINSGDNQIAFDTIRPGHIHKSGATGEMKNSWEIDLSEYDVADVSEEGWIDWVGDGTHDGDYVVDEDQVIVMMGLERLDDPEESDVTVSTLNVDSFGRNVDMLPKDLHSMNQKDNENDVTVQALPAVIGTDKDRVHLRVQLDGVDVGASDETIALRPVGVTYGVGAFMNKEEY